MSEFKDFNLTDYDEDWEKIDPVDNAPVPDGKYQVTVDKVDLTQSKNGNAMLKWHLKILGPTNIGKMLFHQNMIISSENLKWLKKDLELCGLKLSKLSELPDNLEKLLDVQLEVTQKTKTGDDMDFQTIYFNKNLNGVMAVSKKTRPTESPNESELPF